MTQHGINVVHIVTLMINHNMSWESRGMAPSWMRAKDYESNGQTRLATCSFGLVEEA